MSNSSTLALNTNAPAPVAAKHIPGEAGIWIFIVGDMVIFSLFFLVFLHHRQQDLATFMHSQLTLNLHYGVLNTLLLLTSSWLVVSALKAMRRHAFHTARRLLVLGALCGVGFGAVKIIEYSEKIRAGINLATNEFYMFYFMYTGIHFGHVLIGLGVLTFLIFKTREQTYSAGDRMAFEGGAAFWHMVDLLWIVLFPLLYLVK